MPTHWTYAPYGESDGIEQGDILHPTDRLKEILAEVHPHFNNEKYLGFMVGTQSCDLVPRNSSTKAAYISLAVIRPLSQVVHKVLSHAITPVVEGVFRAEDKFKAKQLLGRILNQNEQSLGLFFLYPDADAGLGEAAVVLLRVTVALRAEHYEVLQQARRGRLTPEFRAKLGWLIGNLYVRPATQDWQEGKEGRRQFNRMIQSYLADADWLDGEIIAAAERAGVSISPGALELLEEHRPPSRLERALDEVQSEVSKVAPELSETDVKRLLSLLRNNGTFTKLLKERASPQSPV